MTEYLPEGCLIGTADNRSSLLSYYTLSECMTSGKILEAPCIICDSHHNLILDLGCMKGFIPREEGALGITEGTTKDIALISRVNKPVAFVITDFRENENGVTYAVLSRRLAQERCMRDYLGRYYPGTGNSSGTVRLLRRCRLRYSVAYPYRHDIRVEDNSPEGSFLGRAEYPRCCQVGG